MSNNKVGAPPRLGNPRSATGWWLALSRERKRPYLEPNFIAGSLESANSSILAAWRQGAQQGKKETIFRTELYCWLVKVS